MAVLLLAAIGILLLVQQYLWQDLTLQLLAWQRDLHRALTLAITDWSAAPSWASGWWLMALSFGYGIFHAAGPGHGKAVLSTYLLSQGGGVKRALGLSFSAAMLQGLTAIALVLVLVKGLGWLTRQAMGSVAGLELASFLMVAILGVWLCLRARRMLKQPASAASTLPAAVAPPVGHAPLAAPTFSPVATAHAGQPFHALHAAPAHDHSHAAAGHDCSCGARHHVAPDEAGDWRTALGTVAAIGMRPCSGAVLIMGAASLLGHMALGAAAVMTMALGTAITVSALALASVLARDWVTRVFLKYELKYDLKQSNSRIAQVSRLGGWLAMAGGIVLVWLGLSLAWYATTMPAAGPSLFS
jgi:ABC-type nickel/cobalt efflux system permease component RcnA